MPNIKTHGATIQAASCKRRNASLITAAGFLRWKPPHDPTQPINERASPRGITPRGLSAFTHPKIMPIPALLGQGVFVSAVLLVALARLGARRRSAMHRRYSESDVVVLGSRERIVLDRLPDSQSLAGVPLRILLSDRSSPGSLLRDTLLIRPSERDQ